MDGGYWTGGIARGDAGVVHCFLLFFLYIPSTSSGFNLSFPTCLLYRYTPLEHLHSAYLRCCIFLHLAHPLHPYVCARSFFGPTILIRDRITYTSTSIDLCPFQRGKGPCLALLPLCPALGRSPVVSESVQAQAPTAAIHFPSQSRREISIRNRPHRHHPLPHNLSSNPPPLLSLPASTSHLQRSKV